MFFVLVWPSGLRSRSGCFGGVGKEKGQEAGLAEPIRLLRQIQDRYAQGEFCMMMKNGGCPLFYLLDFGGRIDLKILMQTWRNCAG